MISDTQKHSYTMDQDGVRGDYDIKEFYVVLIVFFNLIFQDTSYITSII